jgi:hypothetical protein
MFRLFRSPAAIADESTLVEAEIRQRYEKQLVSLLRGSQWTCGFHVIACEDRGYCFTFGKLFVLVDISDDLTEVALSSQVYTFKPGDDAETVEGVLKEISSCLQLSRVDNEMVLHHRLPIRALGSFSRFDCRLGGFLEVADEVQIILRRAAKRRTLATRGKALLERVMCMSSRTTM